MRRICCYRLDNDVVCIGIKIIPFILSSLLILQWYCAAFCAGVPLNMDHYLMYITPPLPLEYV